MGQKTFATQAPLSSPRNPESLVYVMFVNQAVSTFLRDISFSIHYPPGINLEEWASCALAQWPSADWPSSGSGIRMSWNQHPDFPSKCDVYTFGVVGTFRVRAEASGVLSLGESFVSGGCGDGFWDSPLSTDTGAIGFGDAEGRDPCYADPSSQHSIPVELATWGRIKAMYTSNAH
jgi:hypothetical protein